jgi:ADP-ribosylglycohydrolase
VDARAAIDQRILAGFVGNAAGDALGRPWEGRLPSQIAMDRVEELPDSTRRRGGATSDDTALTLLVAEHLCEEQGVGAPVRFLERLASRADSIDGLGPSTTRAILRFRETGRPDAGDANTNGAPMRALPLGWVHHPLAAEHRRTWTLELSRMTHGGHGALAAACVVATCASWAIEDAPVDVLVEVAVEEATAVATHLGPGADSVVDALRAVRDDAWTPPSGGVSLDPAETVAAVLHCCRRAGGDLRRALRLAVGLGGDTDTVASIAGGLLGCCHTPAELDAALQWLPRVALPPRPLLVRLSSGLAGLRERLAGKQPP